MAVLIVENDRSLLKLLQAVTTRSGIVTDVKSYEAALPAIRTGRYEAVIFDLMLPEIIGFGILDSLQATHPHLLSRIIILTAAPEAVLKEKLRCQSMVWHTLRKPFDIQELTQTIQDCVAFHTARDLPTSAQLHSWLNDQCVTSSAKASLIASVQSGQSLQLRASFGFAEGLLETIFPLPLGGNYPLCIAARTARPVLLSSLTLARAAEYPLLLPVWSASGSQAIAALPVKQYNLVTGVIGWSFSEPQRFEEAQRTVLLRAAAECFLMIRNEEFGEASSAAS